MKNHDIFADLSTTLAKELFLETVYPWEVLPKIKAFILALGPMLPAEEYEQVEQDVWIHRSAKIWPNNILCGPTISGADSHCPIVRPVLSTIQWRWTSGWRTNSITTRLMPACATCFLM